MDILAEDEEKYNPWDVENITEFLYYCCPECDEKFLQKKLENFVHHAMTKHSNVRYFWFVYLAQFYFCKQTADFFSGN